MKRNLGLVAWALAIPLLVIAGVRLLLPATPLPALFLVVGVLSLVFYGMAAVLRWLIPSPPPVRSDPQFFLDLVEAAPESIIVHRDQVILYANQRAFDFFGVKDLSDQTQSSLLDYVHPSYHEIVYQRQLEIRRTGQPSPPLEMTLLVAEGESREVLVSSTTISFREEPAFLTFFRDITDQVDTRRKLVDSRERLQLALEASQDGVWDWDIPSGKMIYSRAWATMLGFELEELHSDQNAWLYLVHPDDHARSNTLLDAHLRGDLATYETEVRLRHKMGHYLWVLDRGRVVSRSEDGSPLRMTGTHRDITARKEAELALETRNRIAEVFLIADDQDKYHKLLEAVVLSCEGQLGFFATVENQRDLKIQAVHPPDSALVPLHTARKMAASDMPRFLSRVLEDKSSLILAAPHFLRTVGQEFQTGLVVPITSRNEVVGLFMIGNKPQGFYEPDQNLVESLAAYMAPILVSHLNSEMREEQLRQAQKMEALGALAGGIAHDFNNILQAIMGFATLARDEAPPDSLIAGDLQKVLKATRRGQDLVQRILLFSRREEMEHQPVDARTVMEETLELLTPSIPATIEVRPRIAEDCGSIMAEPSQIHQLVMNLATNAFHAMEDEGGVLEIGLKLTESSSIEMENPVLASEDRVVTIWVADTGSGIPKDDQERVFDPFYTTKEVGRGTGLGLSVVHGIVVGHRGEVQIDSELDEGTRVTVYLPMYKAPGQELDDPATGDDGLWAIRPGAHILFVDDEEDITAIGEAMLEKLGYKVSAFSEVPAALDALRESPEGFDLLITDLTMPVMNGLQLAEETRKVAGHLPIILITGLGEEKDQEIRSYPQIRGVVHKPFGLDTLCKTVNRVILESPRPEES